MICDPISPTDRALIDAFIAGRESEGKTVVVPRGVSGMEDDAVISAACWRGCRRVQSKVLRAAMSRLRGDYRRLVDERKSGQEIADILGVKLPEVYQVVRRLGLKLRRVPGDG